MTEHYPDYNPVDWSISLKRYANKAAKYPLCQCSGIWLTKDELNTVEQLHDKVLERLAFTLLCLAKFRNYNNPDNNSWINYSNGEIYSMACINITAFEKDIKFNNLKDLGLIEYAKRVNNLAIQVLYIKEDSEKELFISDFRNLGYEWRLYKGENYVRCSKCGILVKKSGNNQRYCKKCSDDMRTERQRGFMKTKRDC